MSHFNANPQQPHQQQAGQYPHGDHIDQVGQSVFDHLARDPRFRDALTNANGSTIAYTDALDGNAPRAAQILATSLDAQLVGNMPGGTPVTAETIDHVAGLAYEHATAVLDTLAPPQPPTPEPTEEDRLRALGPSGMERFLAGEQRDRDAAATFERRFAELTAGQERTERFDKVSCGPTPELCTPLPGDEPNPPMLEQPIGRG